MAGLTRTGAQIVTTRRSPTARLEMKILVTWPRGRWTNIVTSTRTLPAKHNIKTWINTWKYTTWYVISWLSWTQSGHSSKPCQGSVRVLCIGWFCYGMVICLLSPCSIPVLYMSGMHHHWFVCIFCSLFLSKNKRELWQNRALWV